MTRLRTWLLFTSLVAGYLGRWASLPLPIPASWTPDSTVRFTARILEEPEHTDSKTIIRKGQWSFKVDGYQEFIPGQTYSFVGRVKTELLLGKISKIEMVEPTFTRVKGEQVKPLKWGERAILALGSWRQKMVITLQKELPEPQASLSAGILLGVKAKMPAEFYQDLVNSGTLHVIAASGFNVSVVSAAIMGTLMGLLGRAAVIPFGVLGIVVYVILAGGSASVVRAGIMGSLTLMAYLGGRVAQAERLLWVAAAIMLLINPLLIADVGFQLSVAATAGILYIQPLLVKLLLKRKAPANFFQIFLANYLFPTLAATGATLPVIAWHFGLISLISPVVNMLVLPVVPLTMGLSALALATAWIPGLGELTSYLLYVPLSYLVIVIRFFG